MTRSVRWRLRSLERRVRDRGACIICGGDGAPALIFHFEGEEPRQRPQPCPGCGKVDATVYTIRRAWTRPPAP